MQGAVIPWTERAFSLSVYGSQTQKYDTHAEAVVTYDAALPSPTLLDTVAYRWRSDDGTEAGATYLAGENTPVSSGVYVGDRLRLRVQVTNIGEATTSILYRLEYSSSSCTVWQPVPTSPNGEHWAMDITQFVANAASTTDSSGISNPGGMTFTPGYMMTNGNTTGAHDLGYNYFTEHEWSIRSTSAVTPGTTYCFRMTNNGNTYHMVYSVVPQISVTATFARPTGGGASTEGSGSGSQQQGGGQGGGAGVEGGGTGSGQTGGGQGGGGGLE
jgi:hypothetical protein